MITFDQLIRLVSILATLVVILLIGGGIIWACLRARNPVWYWCPKCGRWESDLGVKLPEPPEAERLGGHNLCRECYDDAMNSPLPR